MMTNPDDARVETTSELPRTMRAVVQHEYGTAEQLHVEEVELPPAPVKGDVLLDVAAAGLDRGTWHLMTGQPYLARPGMGLRRPRRPIPGLDVAGTVIAVGPDVTRFAPGDRVFGIAKGSFAEFALAREDKLALRPPSLTAVEAAVLGVSGLTALQALRDSGRVEAGQQVLILGASGGVGTYAVQVAKAFGAEVTGVCSGAKTDLVRSLGADRIIDYQRQDPIDGSTRYDLIIDIGGNRKVARLRRALVPTGTLVIVGGENAGRWTGGLGRQFRAAARSPFVRHRLAMVISAERADDLEALAALVNDGQLRPSLDSVVPLPRVADAMRKLESGQVRGKIGISISGD